MKKPEFVFNDRVLNWPSYNRAPVERGRLTVWVDELAVARRRAEPEANARGRPRVHADTAIESALVIKAVFHLSLRATQGFLGSVFRLMGVTLPVPDHTTLCGRQLRLGVRLDTRVDARPRHLVIGSTGLKVYGAGEWNLRKHGRQRGTRRIWRKLHPGVDATTTEIVAVALTPSRLDDSHRLPRLRDAVTSPLAQVSADKGYDSAACYEAVVARGAAPTIPPRRRSRGGRLHDPPPGEADREEVLRRIAAGGAMPGEARAGPRGRAWPRTRSCESRPCWA